VGIDPPTKILRTFLARLEIMIKNIDHVLDVHVQV